MIHVVHTLQIDATTMKSYSEKRQRAVGKVLEQRIRKHKSRKGLDLRQPRRKTRSVPNRRRIDLEPGSGRRVADNGGEKPQSVYITDDGGLPDESDSGCENLAQFEQFASKGAMIVETFPLRGPGGPDNYSNDTPDDKAVKRHSKGLLTAPPGVSRLTGSSGQVASEIGATLSERLDSWGVGFESPSSIQKQRTKRRVSLIDLPDVSIVEVDPTSESEDGQEEQSLSMDDSRMDLSREESTHDEQISGLCSESEETEKPMADEEASARESERGGKLADEIIRVFKHKDTDHCFIIFKEDFTVPFLGKGSIEVLCGEVSVNGFRMKASGRSYPLYSTHFTALSQLEVSCTAGSSRTEGDGEVKKRICHCLEDQDVEELEEFLGGCRFSAMLLQPLPCHAWDYISRFGSYKRITTNINYESDIFKRYQPLFRGLGFFLCVGAHPGAFETRSLRTLPGQAEAIECIFGHLDDEGNPPPVIVVCGKQGTGKSTMARHVINQLLNETDGICYIEADVGQSELTPSCLLSLQHVEEPLLGLPFTHQRKAERTYFFGCNETKYAPDLYIDMLTNLYQYYTENHPSKPLVVNTNGHMQGIGGNLIQDILHITQPTHVILLEDPLDKHPFQFSSVHGWVSGEAPTKLAPTILRMEPAPHSESGHVFVRIGSSGHRGMTLMSYFSPMVRAPNWSLAEVVPYAVPWSAVAVHVCNTAVPPNSILYALNGSVVGLCCLKPDMIQEFAGATTSENLPKTLGTTPLSSFDCLGLGIIRGIDPVAKVFYIITPVPAGELPRVTALVKGNNFLRLPVMMQGVAGKEAPYVCRSYTDNPGCMVPKKRTKFLVRKKAPI